MLSWFTCIKKFYRNNSDEWNFNATTCMDIKIFLLVLVPKQYLPSSAELQLIKEL